MNQNSISNSLHRRLAAGTESVAFDIDLVFRDRLCRLVDREMHQIYKRRQDPEDIVQSVLKSFFKRAKKGEYFFEDQESIWSLLKQVARNKLRKQITKDKTQKQDVFRELHDNDEILVSPVSVNDAQAHVLGAALEIALSRTESPTPDFFRLQLFGYEIMDIVHVVLEGLAPPYPRILQLRLQGHSELAIGLEIGCGREADRYKLKRMEGRLKYLLDQHESS